jgi:uncharacterized membrane protein YgaE (UPF0421/DUF939 family)
MVITQSSLGATLAVSWQRFVGTAVGAALGALVASHFETHTLVFAASVFLLGLFCAGLRTQTNQCLGLGFHYGPPAKLGLRRTGDVLLV